MKISAYQSVGSRNVSVDIEYNSENVSDCVQTDKFVSRILKESKPENDDAGRDRMSQYLKDCCCETGIRRQEETPNAQL